MMACVSRTSEAGTSWKTGMLEASAPGVRMGGVTPKENGQMDRHATIIGAPVAQIGSVPQLL